MDPVSIALIGCGRRGQSVYYPILRALRDSLRVAAVCDRVPALARTGAEAFGVPAYDSLAQLVQDRPMEAAIVVTPGSSHHAISCYLSAHGIHHLVETPIADTVAQARQMVAAAADQGVIFRVGEQFFRDPFDILSRRLIAAGVIGPIGRLTNYHAHLGYHNNSRHQVLAGGPPIAVNAIEHTMPTLPYINTGRHYTREVFHNCSFHFPNDLLVTDIAGNIKGALGRYARPGLHEIDGAQGTIVRQASDHWCGRAEVRLVPAARLIDGSGAYSDRYPIYFQWRTAEGRLIETEEQTKRLAESEHAFAGVVTRLPQGEFRVANEFLDHGLTTAYHPEVAGHLRDFALLLRTGAPDPFTPEMAVMSLVMEQAAALSAQRQGARVAMTDPATAEIDARRLAAVQQRLGLDPLDIEAMVNYSFPQV